MKYKNHYTDQSIFDKLGKYTRGIAFGTFVTFLAVGSAVCIKKAEKAHVEHYSALNPKTTQIAPAEESELERFFINITPEEQEKLGESFFENLELSYKEGNNKQLNLETSVNEMLANYKIWEKNAYKEILSHKVELEQIALQYENISPALLMAVLKKESSGLTYRRSKAGATGQMQLLFKGSYSFFWSVFNNDNDPYYKKIWKRYAPQLDEIFSELIENEIYVEGDKGETWRRLKHYFKNNHFYQNVDMGALYLDFLINKFKNKKLGLADYNAGETEVRKAGGIPNFGETKRYVKYVLQDTNVFKKLLKI